MLLVSFQQRILFVRPVADVRREGVIFPLKICSGTVHPALQRLDSIILFVVQCLLDCFVEASSRKIGLNAGIQGMLILLKPHAQFFQFVRSESSYSAFNLLDCV